MGKKFFFKRLNRMWAEKCYYYEFGQVPRYLKEQKLGYLPVNKVACTSIKAALSPRGTAKQHVDFLEATVADVSDLSDYFLFTVVRNPFERLVSCYKHKVLSQKPPHTFDEYFLGYLKRSTSFANFVRRIRWIPHQFHDGHFASQYNTIYKRKLGGAVLAGKFPDFIGRFEHLGDDWKVIKERFDVDDIPHRNATSKDDWRDYYDVKTAKLVYKLYRKDVQAFGYEEDYRKLLTYLKEKEDTL